MDNGKPGVMIYFDILPALEKLPIEKTGALLMAALKYAHTGQAPTFDDAVLDFAWMLIKPSIDRDGEAYKKKREHGAWLTYCRQCKQDGIKPLDFETYRQRTDNELLQDSNDTLPTPTPSPTPSPTPVPSAVSSAEYGYSPEPQAASGPEPVCLIPLNTGQEYAVTAEQAEEFAKLYPAVDVYQQLNNMRGWCLANPQKRKTQRGILQFINGWLSREQDKGGKHVSTPKDEKTNNPFLRLAMEMEEGGA